MTSRIYVGNLPPDVRSSDLRDIFYKYGKILSVDVKADSGRRGPPFAFVEFDDLRDAEDAVRARDGYNFDGYTLRVEFSRGAPRGAGSHGPGGYGPPPKRYYNGGGGGAGGSGGGSRRTDYRVCITGLPATGSWQDIKDHMRVAGDVCYADVYRNGVGVCEFVRYEDMKYAIRKLDDSKFRSHEGESSYIRVKEDGHRNRSRSSSYSRSRSRSRSRSLSDRRSRSRS